MNTCEKCGRCGDDVLLDIEFGKMECDRCHNSGFVPVFDPLPSYDDFADDAPSVLNVSRYCPMSAVAGGYMFEMYVSLRSGVAYFRVRIGFGRVLLSGDRVHNEALDRLFGIGWRFLLAKYRRDSLDMLNSEYVN